MDPGPSNKISKTENVESTTNAFTFREIESSLPKFSGDDHYSVGKWIQDLENMAEVMGWSEMQKFIYGKLSLTGTAKQFLRIAENIDGWATLKEELKNEFKKEMDSKSVHEMLKVMSMKKEESLQQYYYRIKEIGVLADVEEEVLVNYAVDGIPGTTSNKILLYEANTYKKLKVKYELFLKLKLNSNENETVVKNHTNSRAPSTSRCGNCGQKGHMRSDCRNKNKKRCFYMQ